MDDSDDSNFPGLNKAHGFFLSIENNQSNRESYHWRQVEEKEKKKDEAENQHLQIKSDRRKKKRERQKPDRLVYRPPHIRTHTQPCYCVEIEVLPDIYWRQDVSELGKGVELTRIAAERFQLDEVTRQVLEEFLYEFETKLKM